MNWRIQVREILMSMSRHKRVQRDTIGPEEGRDIDEEGEQTST